jgi:hypothetical protein
MNDIILRARTGSKPATRMLPELKRVSPATSFSNVDFPHPEGPIILTNSDSGIDRLMSSKTGCALP